MKLNRRGGGLRPNRRQVDDFSPMDGLGNMADAMLVFACGLLIALILSWNVEVTDQGVKESIQTKYEVDSIDEQASETPGDEKNLEEMGKVYKDPETGKYYVVED